MSIAQHTHVGAAMFAESWLIKQLHDASQGTNPMQVCNAQYVQRSSMVRAQAAAVDVAD